MRTISSIRSWANRLFHAPGLLPQTTAVESGHIIACYVSGQPNYTTVLVGFNPVKLARSAPIEKWNKTCKDVSALSNDVSIDRAQ